MTETEHRASVTEMTAIFMEKIIEADVAMQLKQYETWREAATKEPLLESLVKRSDTRNSSSDGPHLVFSSLLEGIDRLNNLALSETCLEIELEEIRPSLFKRLRAWFQGRSVSSQFRLAPPKHRRRRSRVQLKLTVKRNSKGDWQVHSETIPDEGIAPDVLVPVIK